MRIKERLYEFVDEQEIEEFIESYLDSKTNVISNEEEKWLDDEYNRIYATYAYADMSSPQ